MPTVVSLVFRTFFNQYDNIEEEIEEKYSYDRMADGKANSVGWQGWRQPEATRAASRS